ncbi:MAG: hypothetical protein JWR63_1771 [Conexibacter sp.]|nr:hypothetical protein [Conexibacter sp.]MCW2999903.1 hypothetical protein [Solirubrobacterales bacterium]
MSAVGPSLGDPRPDVMAAMAMTAIAQLSMDGRVRLERALTLQLQEPDSPARRRVAELGPLADLLEKHGEPYDDPVVLRQLASELYLLERHRDRLPREERHLLADEIRSLRKRSRDRIGTPVVDASLYDRLRPAGSPAAETLGRRFGGWHKACRAAYGLQPDGSTIGPGRPWATPVHASRGVPLYSEDGCIDAVRRCARSLLRVPSSQDYVMWQWAQRRRQPGKMPADLGLPAIGTVLKRFTTWQAVLDAAAICRHELAELRAAQVPSEAAHPAVEGARRDEVLSGRELGRLPLSEAIALAVDAQVSIEWLAGDDNSVAPAPPAGAGLDTMAIRARRAETKVRDDALARAAKCTTGQWRQALAGRREFSAGQILAVASLLRCATSDLLQPEVAATA